LIAFQRCLTPAQREEFSTVSLRPDANSVIKFTTEIDEENWKRRKSRNVATRINDFLQSVEEFSSIVETMVSSNPAIAALVWGSVKFAIIVSLTGDMTDIC
jgi:hypothetical protein